MPREKGFDGEVPRDLRALAMNDNDSKHRLGRLHYPPSSAFGTFSPQEAGGRRASMGVPRDLRALAMNDDDAAENS